MKTQSDKANWFHRSHQGPGILVLPNAWDAGSAIMMAEAGFLAIATTSAGIAFSLGLPDGQHVARKRMLERVSQIAAAVPVPVTADLEAGYGPAPADVAAAVQGAVDAGAVGCNIEDSTGDPLKPLFDAALACDRIRAGAEAALGRGVPFVLNARVDSYLVPNMTADEAFKDAVDRANAYRAAGAGCLFVPGPLDAETIGRLAREISGPLNVLGARAGFHSPLSAADLAELGVKRVSIGASLSVAVLDFVQTQLRELREHGGFGYTGINLSNAKLNGLLESYRRQRELPES